MPRWLGGGGKREQTFKLDQEREHEAMMLGTARLRELRLGRGRREWRQAGSSAPRPEAAPIQADLVPKGSDRHGLQPNYRTAARRPQPGQGAKKQEKLKRLEEGDG